MLGFQFFSDCTFLVGNTRVLKRPVVVAEAGGEEGDPPPPRPGVVFAGVRIIPSELEFILMFQFDKEGSSADAVPVIWCAARRRATESRG